MKACTVTFEWHTVQCRSGQFQSLADDMRLSVSSMAFPREFNINMAKNTVSPMKKTMKILSKIRASCAHSLRIISLRLFSQISSRISRVVSEICSIIASPSEESAAAERIFGPVVSDSFWVLLWRQLAGHWSFEASSWMPYRDWDCNRNVVS